jgi:hypothetical protein
MKTKKEIEQLAESQYGTEIGSIRGSNPYDLEKDRKNGFIKGYTQCQEDMKQYIFEVAFQFHRLGKYSGTISDTHFTDIYEQTINSLNKQD